MTEAELLVKAHQAIASLKERHGRATAALDDAAINAHPGGVHWSIAEITEHLHLANHQYLNAMDFGMKTAKKGDGSQTATQSMLGRLIEYGAGPRAASPAPKVLFPKPGPYSKESLASFAADMARFDRMLSDLQNVDLSRTKFRNPFMRMFRMTMTDGINILIAHSERHVGQIESIARSLA